MDANWQANFPVTVLGRGLDYYAEGAVARLKAGAHGYTAVVRGSDDYDVFIADDVEESSCTCPYFEDRGLCKHIAAVCFAIEGGESCSKTAGGTGLSADVEALAESIGPQERDAYLLKILREDATWRAAFVKRYSNVDIASLKRDFLRGVKEIVRNNSYRGFIDYRNALRCEHELSEFVCAYFDPLMEKGAYADVFRLSLDFASASQRIDVDDSDGFSCSMMGLCADYWARLAEEGGTQLRAEMLAQLGAYLEDAAGDSDDDDADDDLWYAREEMGEFIAEKLSCYDDVALQLGTLVDAQLAKASASMSGAQGPYSSSRELVRWAQAKARCLAASGQSVAQVEEFILGLPPFPELRKPLVDVALANGDGGKAIALLEALIAQSADLRFPKEEAVQLYELQRECGDAKGMRATLLALIRRGQAAGDGQLKKWLRDLRSCCGEEWPEMEARLVEEFAALPQKDTLRAFYVVTERYDKLMESLNAASRYELGRYWDDLVQRYPDEYLACYENDVRKSLAGRGGSRSLYRLQAETMERMCEIPGGARAVAALAADLRAQYPRRHALLEEIRRF